MYSKCMKNIENLVGRMHQKSGDSLLNWEGWNVCSFKPRLTKFKVLYIFVNAMLQWPLNS